MSYTKDFLYDVFISYASRDEETENLISDFRRKLDSHLHAQGIREDISIFFDETRMTKGKPVDDQIIAAASSSAIMVLFHSPSYEKSEDWCHLEFRRFVDSCRNLDGRLFIVALDGKRLPKDWMLLRKTNRHPSFFHTQVDGFAFTPNRPDYRNKEQHSYIEEVQILAREIAASLDVFRNDTKSQRVFLTCAGEFQAQMEDIRTELTEQGFLVLSSSPYLDQPERVAAAKIIISQAELVITIEGKFANAKFENQKIHSAEQIDIGKSKSRMRWLPSEGHGLTSGEVDHLKSQPDVIATNLEAFKREIINRLTLPKAPVPRAPTELPANGKREMALLICALVDDDVALTGLSTLTDTLSFWRDELVDGGEITDVEKWRLEVKERAQILNPTKIIFVDGLCHRDWIDGRLRAYLALERDLPGAPRAYVYEYVPLPKKDRRRLKPPPDRIRFIKYDDDDLGGKFS